MPADTTARIEIFKAVIDSLAKISQGSDHGLGAVYIAQECEYFAA